MDIGGSNTVLHLSIDASGAVTGSAQFNQALNSVKQSATSATSAVELLGKAVALLGGALVLRQAASEALHFNEAITRVKVVAQGSQQQIDALTDSIKKQAVEFGNSPTEQAQALYQIMIHGAGDAEQSNIRLAASNELARASGMNLTDAALTLGQVMDSYKGSVKNATEASDILMTTMEHGGGSIDEIGLSMRMVAPQANQLGVSLKELAALISASSQAGLSQRQSLMGLRDILMSLSQPSDSVSKAAEVLGIHMSIADVKARGFSAVMHEIAERTGGNAKNLQALGLSATSLVSVLVAGGYKGNEFGKALENLEHAEGATKRASDLVAESLDNRFKKALSAVKLELEKVGEEILKHSIPAFESVVKHIDEVERAVITIVGSYILLRGAAIASTIAMTALNLVMDANPIGLVVTAIAAATAGLYIFSDRLGDIKGTQVTVSDLMENSWTIISGLITASYRTSLVVWDAMPEDYKKIMEDTKTAVQKVLDAMVKAVKEAYATILETMKPFAAKFGEGVKGAANQILSWLNLENLDELGNRIGNAGSILGTTFTEEFKKAVEQENASGVLDAMLRGSGKYAPWKGSGDHGGRGSAVFSSPSSKPANDVPPEFTGSTADKLLKIDDIFRQLRNDVANEQASTGLTIKQHDILIEKLKIEQDLAKDKIFLSKGQKDELLNLLQKKQSLTEINAARGQYLLDDQKMKNDINNEIATQGMTRDMHDIIIKKLQIEQALKEKGVQLSQEEDAQLQEQMIHLHALREAAALPRPLEEWNKALKNTGVEIQQNLVQGFKQAADSLASFVVDGTGQLSSFSDILKNLAKQFISLQIQKQIFSPLADFGTSFFKGFFGSDGLAFDSGNVTAMSVGGLINQPTLFPMANGGVAMGGEAGTEAIMPLRRLGNGRLGIESTGSGSSVFAPSISISISGDVSGNSQKIAEAVKQQVNEQMSQSMKQFQRGQGGTSDTSMMNQIDTMNETLLNNSNSKTSRAMSRNTSAVRTLGG